MTMVSSPSSSVKGVPAAIDLDLGVLTGRRDLPQRQPEFQLSRAHFDVEVQAYQRLRRDFFVTKQGLFLRNDLDETDFDPRTIVLVARDRRGEIVGGVRLAPAGPGADIGWWTGSRLVVSPAGQAIRGIGSALIRAAGAAAETVGALRFEATVQAQNETLFTRLGWESLRQLQYRGLAHMVMRYPIDRIARLANATKAALAVLLEPFTELGDQSLGGAGFVGDDGAPVAGTDVIAACDAILPSMVERTPEWAGWCAVLVNINDLSAMGAKAAGLLDSLGARDASFARRVISGLRDAAAAWRVPVIGGHTQLGVPASLSVTALGRTTDPVPAGGGRLGDRLCLTVDLGGSWRPGYAGSQWDSTSARSSGELAAMADLVALTRPHAAKDVSMAGIAGTTGMLAEASGLGAVIDVASVPRPVDVSAGDWLTCFPGFGMLTADRPDRAVAPAGPAVTAACGELAREPGVWLRWPDGEQTLAVTTVTGLGKS